MAYAARVLRDSISPAGVRLTTMEVTFPRFVLSEFNTHRVLSRNSASSRAIPSSKLIERVLNDPVLPLEWGLNQKGMQAGGVLSPEEAAQAERAWLAARDAAAAQAQRLLDLKVHKQVLNRVLEPFLWHTVIVSATEWDNFFELRSAPAAQPEIRAAALAMRRALEESSPVPVALGEWHLPLVQDDERAGLPLDVQKKISVARAGRVSYLTHEGVRDVSKDVELHDRLKSERHLSPFEHVATPAEDVNFHANFRGWIQMRAEIEARPRLAASGG